MRGVSLVLCRGCVYNFVFLPLPAETPSYSADKTSSYAPSFFLVYFLHGRHAFTIQSLYDTDDVIYSPGSVLNWLEIGRQGNVFTKKVFGLL